MGVCGNVEIVKRKEGERSIQIDGSEEDLNFLIACLIPPLQRDRFPSSIGRVSAPLAAPRGPPVRTKMS